MKTSQNKWVADQLNKQGVVSRNQALNHNITRLAARIADLKETGLEIIARRNGKDYEYVLIK